MSGATDILVVDDSALSRAWAVRVLRDEGYSVAVATDGAAAVEQVREHEPDVIVVDDEMPGLSGKQLVEVLRGDGVCSGIVMLTDSDDNEDERGILRAGVDDLVRRPCAARIVVRAVSDARLRGSERRVRHDREHHLDGEVRAAAAIQAALVPAPFSLDGWALQTGFLPASQVGGDCFDAFRGPNGTLCLLLADVSGKGVGAALLAAMAQTAVRAAFGRGDGPEAALAAANSVLFDFLARVGRFLTAFAAQVDLTTGRVAYADAGHGHALVLTAAGGERDLPAGGHPLGLLPATTYERGHVDLAAGERLAIFSDGLVEGEEDVDLCRASLVEALHMHTHPAVLVREAPDADDRTMILLERLA